MKQGSQENLQRKASWFPGFLIPFRFGCGYAAPDSSVIPNVSSSAFICFFRVIRERPRSPQTTPITQSAASSAVPFGCGPAALGFVQYIAFIGA
jgi:hypothetical protein